MLCRYFHPNKRHFIKNPNSPRVPGVAGPNLEVNELNSLGKLLTVAAGKSAPLSR
jgi:hypothetical protein